MAARTGRAAAAEPQPAAWPVAPAPPACGVPGHVPAPAAAPSRRFARPSRRRPSSARRLRFATRRPAQRRDLGHRGIGGRHGRRDRKLGLCGLGLCDVGIGRFGFGGFRRDRRRRSLADGFASSVVATFAASRAQAPASLATGTSARRSVGFGRLGGGQSVRCTERSDLHGVRRWRNHRLRLGRSCRRGRLGGRQACRDLRGSRIGRLLRGWLRLDPQHGQHRLRRLVLLREPRLRRRAPGRIGGKFLMGGPQQGSRAETEDENGDGQQRSRQTGNGSRGAFRVRFPPPQACCGGPGAKWERGDLQWESGSAFVRRRESGSIRGYRKRCSAFVKIRCRRWCNRLEKRFSGNARLCCHGLDGTSQIPEIGRKAAGIVLNAPRSSVMCR